MTPRSWQENMPIDQVLIALTLSFSSLIGECCFAAQCVSMLKMMLTLGAYENRETLVDLLKRAFCVVDQGSSL